MQLHFITSDPKILNGKPIIHGLRISVEIILEWLYTGSTIEAIYQEYKHLPKGSVEESIRYATQFQRTKILMYEI